MIEINLLPGARKKTTSRGPSMDMSAQLAALTGRFKDTFLIGAVAAAVIGAAGLGWMYYDLGKKETALAEFDKKVHADSARFAAMFAENTKVTATRDTLLRQINLIRTIDQDRYIWAHILEEVSRALPIFTWVRTLSIIGTPQGQQVAVALPPPPPPKEPDPKLPPTRPPRIETVIPPDKVEVRIAGTTVDIEALTRFWRQLEASPFIATVNLEDSKGAADPGGSGKQVTTFQLTLLYARPDSSQLRRVPLVVKVK